MDVQSMNQTNLMQFIEKKITACVGKILCICSICSLQIRQKKSGEIGEFFCQESVNPEF